MTAISSGAQRAHERAEGRGPNNERIGAVDLLPARRTKTQGLAITDTDEAHGRGRSEGAQRTLSLEGEENGEATAAATIAGSSAIRVPRVRAAL
jgi:hypothetical protein